MPAIPSRRREYLVAFELQIIPQALQDRGLVLHHQHAVHTLCSIGRINEKTDPFGSLPRTSTRPPCAATTCATTVNPKPTPGTSPSGHGRAEKLLEDALSRSSAGNANALIEHFYDRFAAGLTQPQLDFARVIRIFHGIRQQVQNGLFQCVGVGPHHRSATTIIASQAQNPCCANEGPTACTAASTTGTSDIGLQPVIAAALFDLRERQHLIHQPRQPLALARDGLQILALLLRDPARGPAPGFRRTSECW